MVLARHGTSNSQVAVVTSVPKGKGVVNVRVWRVAAHAFGPEKTLPLRDVSEPPAASITIDARIAAARKAYRAEMAATKAALTTTGKGKPTAVKTAKKTVAKKTVAKKTTKPAK